MGLTATDILSSSDRVLHCVAVPEWGGDVYVPEFSIGEIHSIIRPILAERTGEDSDDIMLLPRLVAASVCDEHGAKLFGDDQRDVLDGKSFKVIKRIADEIMTVNGLSGDAVEEARGN